MRVPRTFAFVDLSGFTNYTAAFGDDAAGRILGAFRGIARVVASQHGVRIAKWLGDGCMIVAINQIDCIAFAIDLEARCSQVCSPLTLRTGIASGHALLFEGDDYIGSSVNMASRLCDAAGPSEILMPAVQLEQLPQGVHATAHGGLELRGFPGEIEVFNFSGVLIDTDERDDNELWTRAPFGL